MVSLIICLVIMQKKFSNQNKNFIRLNLSRKQRFWLNLPYQLRLRIEHLTYFANLVSKHSDVIQMTRLSKWLYLKIAPYYDDVVRLNNPYKPLINAPISDEKVAQSINNFLKRFQ